MFSLHCTSPLGRRGKIQTAHGAIETPFFLPVATAGAMRGITLEELTTLGADALLSNTYHLHVHPGEKVVAAAGGVHKFIGFEKPILTDSGGFQVFSLAGLRKISARGVHFQSHRDGSHLFLGPEKAMKIQHALGADILMCFDECPPSTAPRSAQLAAVDRTIRWAKTCKVTHQKLCKQTRRCPLLFGIVQGGLEQDLRKKCAEELIAIGFDGYAVGGLAVGETESEMLSILDCVCPILPVGKPRYLMGVGRLSQIHEAVARGIDMFDCVLPMREARHGKIFLSDGKSLDLRKRRFLKDHSPIDARSPAPSSRMHTKAYLCHLLRTGERYGETLACLQNMAVTLEAFRSLRGAIDAARNMIP